MCTSDRSRSSCTRPFRPRFPLARDPHRWRPCQTWPLHCRFPCQVWSSRINTYHANSKGQIIGSKIRNEMKVMKCTSTQILALNMKQLVLSPFCCNPWTEPCAAYPRQTWSGSGPQPGWWVLRKQGAAFGNALYDCNKNYKMSAWRNWNKKIVDKLKGCNVKSTYLSKVETEVLLKHFCTIST